MSVLVNLEIGRALDLDVFLPVNSDKRYFLEYFQGCFGVCSLVVLHVIRQLVNIILDKLTPLRYDDFLYLMCLGRVGPGYVLCRQRCCCKAGGEG